MGLQVTYCFSQQCDSLKAIFNDSTGVFSYDNETGYGTPNPESSTFTSASISILPPNYINPIVFSFTLSANVVTAATRTDEYGTVTNVLSLLNTTDFPFVDLEFNSVLLFDGNEDDLIADGVWQVVYSISDGTDVYELEAYNYFVNNAKRCKDDASVKASTGRMTKSDAINIFFNYDMLLNGVGLKDNTFVTNQIEIMQSLCNECNNC